MTLLHIDGATEITNGEGMKSTTPANMAVFGTKSALGVVHSASYLKCYWDPLSLNPSINSPRWVLLAQQDAHVPVQKINESRAGTPDMW